MLFFAHSANPLILWHHLQENNAQTLWLVQDIQMLWYGWCEIHILIQQINWCEQHTTLLANKFQFFIKKITQKAEKA